MWNSEMSELEGISEVNIHLLPRSPFTGEQTKEQREKAI